jgi:hypothetical protein
MTFFWPTAKNEKTARPARRNEQMSTKRNPIGTAPRPETLNPKMICQNNAGGRNVKGFLQKV